MPDPRFAGLVALVLLPALEAGCGPTCQSTCNRLYTEEDDGCNLQNPSMSQGQLISNCMEMCERALAIPGEQGSYDPNERRQGSGSAVTLENDEQAAAWMDCVAETSCEDLGKGYCEPVYN